MIYYVVVSLNMIMGNICSVTDATDDSQNALVGVFCKCYRSMKRCRLVRGEFLRMFVQLVRANNQVGMYTNIFVDRRLINCDLMSNSEI